MKLEEVWFKSVNVVKIVAMFCCLTYSILTCTEVEVRTVSLTSRKDLLVPGTALTSCPSRSDLATTGACEGL